jgi:hypothetical protein
VTLLVNVAQLTPNQIFVALKEYKKLPYTFVYLFALFLLSDVRAIVIAHQDNADPVTHLGIGHDSHTRVDLPKRSIRVLILAEYIP